MPLKSSGELTGAIYVIFYDTVTSTGNGSGDVSNGEVTESKPVGEDENITSSNGAATPAKGKGKGTV